MKDRCGRIIDYMRVSITDRCNLRCRYCMPEGCQWLPMEELLTLEEIREVCAVAAEEGISKIKLTGGEPLVRKGVVELVEMLHEIPGIEQITLTTNGVLLGELAQPLARAGLSAVNVSLDTLDREKYRKITGRDALDKTLEGIQAAQEAGLRLKVNAVLQEGVNAGEWLDLARLAERQALDVRFIEMMPIGHGKEFHPVSNQTLLERFREVFRAVEPDERSHGNGPAVYYTVPEWSGSVGFISAIHGKFCAQCNRIRMTSTGFLKGCLCYEDGLSLREAVREGNKEEVRRRIQAVIYSKPDGHCFDRLNEITESREMSKIGG